MREANQMTQNSLVDVFVYISQEKVKKFPPQEQKNHSLRPCEMAIDSKYIALSTP